MSSSKSRSKPRKKQGAASSPPRPAISPVVSPASAPVIESKPPKTPFVQTRPRVPQVSVPDIKTPPHAAPTVEPKPMVEPTPLDASVGPPSPPSDRYWIAAMGVMIVAIILRQVQLGQAPFHPDESIHAFFSYGFGGYHYDPVYHGPLLYHLVALFFKAFGQYDYVARLVPSLLGIGLVAMVLGPARRWMGNRAALAAAGLIAVSPSIVTYSRHLLHDALALDLTMGAVLCFITALHHPADDKRGRLALFSLAACLSLFLATKANFFFILVVILAFYGSWKFPGRAFPAFGVAVAVASGLAFELLPIVTLQLPSLLPLWNFFHPARPNLTSQVTFVLVSGFGVIAALILVAGAAFLTFKSVRRFTPHIPTLPFSRAWPATLFAIVTFSSIFWPRDNTFPTPIQASQHRIFQIVAVVCCAALLFWTSGRPEDGLEREGRARWKIGNDWTTWIFSLAIAIWIYMFLFGQGAQMLAQWATNRSFPGDTWISGRDGALHAIQKMLDYWGGQQKKPRLPGRHDYYIVLGLLYELPIYIAAVGGIWHATKKRTVFSDFLLWWAFASWAVYAVANEKVPWLLVHILLPLALLGALWIASVDWRKPLFFAATCAGLAFALRGDVAMVFERAGDHAEPLLYAQAPDNFRDALASALQKTRGDGRAIWMNGERQWPSVWYLRDTKWNPIRGTSGTPIAANFEPDKYRAFIAQETDIPKLKNKAEWEFANRGLPDLAARKLDSA